MAQYQILLVISRAVLKSFMHTVQAQDMMRRTVNPGEWNLVAEVRRSWVLQSLMRASIMLQTQRLIIRVNTCWQCTSWQHFYTDSEFIKGQFRPRNKLGWMRMNHSRNTKVDCFSMIFCSCAAHTSVYESLLPVQINEEAKQVVAQFDHGLLHVGLKLTPVVDLSGVEHPHVPHRNLHIPAGTSETSRWVKPDPPFTLF